MRDGNFTRLLAFCGLLLGLLSVATPDRVLAQTTDLDVDNIGEAAAGRVVTDPLRCEHGHAAVFYSLSLEWYLCIPEAGLASLTTGGSARVTNYTLLQSQIADLADPQADPTLSTRQTQLAIIQEALTTRMQQSAGVIIESALTPEIIDEINLFPLHFLAGTSAEPQDIAAVPGGETIAVELVIVEACAAGDVLCDPDLLDAAQMVAFQAQTQIAERLNYSAVTLPLAAETGLLDIAVPPLAAERQIVRLSELSFWVENSQQSFQGALEGDEITVVPPPETILMTTFDTFVYRPDGTLGDHIERYPLPVVATFSPPLPFNSNAIAVARWDADLNRFRQIPSQYSFETNEFIYSTDEPGLFAYLQLLPARAAENGSTLFGTAQGDALLGRDGDDSLNGQAGDDILRGRIGKDQLSGGDGSDLLDGGFGDDLLSGGPGDDMLLLSNGRDAFRSDGGIDTIFSPNLTPLIVIGEGQPYESVEIMIDSDELVYAVFPDGTEYILRETGDSPWKPYNIDVGQPAPAS